MVFSDHLCKNGEMCRGKDGERKSCDSHFFGDTVNVELLPATSETVLVIASLEAMNSARLSARP